MPQVSFPRPKVALRNAASFPGQVLPAGLGRPLAGVLNSAVDALPDINFPTSLPSLPLPSGLSAPPGPRDFALRAETVLPVGAPRISSLIPDIQLPTAASPMLGVGQRSADGFRPLETTSSRQSGGTRAGGYRSI